MPAAGPYDRDLKFEDTLRPGAFDDFIGQRKTVQNLQVAIKAAQEAAAKATAEGGMSKSAQKKKAKKEAEAAAKKK